MGSAVGLPAVAARWTGPHGQRSGPANGSSALDWPTRAAQWACLRSQRAGLAHMGSAVGRRMVAARWTGPHGQRSGPAYGSSALDWPTWAACAHCNWSGSRPKRLEQPEQRGCGVATWREVRTLSHLYRFTEVQPNGRLGVELWPPRTHAPSKERLCKL
eukprot:365351-Chlamydomonas_euryale.AAC.5